MDAACATVTGWLEATGGLWAPGAEESDPRDAA
jgi:hypothetical protein